LLPTEILQFGGRVEALHTSCDGVVGPFGSERAGHALAALGAAVLRSWHDRGRLGPKRVFSSERINSASTIRKRLCIYAQAIACEVAPRSVSRCTDLPTAGVTNGIEQALGLGVQLAERSRNENWKAKCSSFEMTILLSSSNSNKHEGYHSVFGKCSKETPSTCIVSHLIF